LLGKAGVATWSQVPLGFLSSLNGSWKSGDVLPRIFLSFGGNKKVAFRNTFGASAGPGHQNSYF
jgi:hypothetical protein